MGSLRAFYHVGFFRFPLVPKNAAKWVPAAIMIAEASIDDVERLVLEAIAARSDAEAVTVG